MSFSGEKKRVYDEITSQIEGLDDETRKDLLERVVPVLQGKLEKDAIEILLGTAEKVKCALETGKDKPIQIAVAEFRRKIFAVKSGVKEQSFPIDEKIFTPENIEALEKEKGLPIQDMSVSDKSLFRLQIGGTVYVDTCASIFRRIAANYFKDKNKPALGKAYLAYRKKGFNHQQAQTKAHEGVPGQNFLPTSPNTLKPEFIQQLEDGIKKPILEWQTTDDEKFAVSIGNREYDDTLMLFLHRLGRQEGITSTQAIAYLGWRKKGLPHANALKKSNEGKPDVAIMVPVDSDTFDQEFIIAMEAGAGDVNQWVTRELNDFTFKYKNKEYKDSPMKLLTRIAKKFFGTRTKLNLAKAYLSWRKKGKTHEDAIQKSPEGFEGMSLPTNPDFYSPEIVHQIETSLGKPIQNVPVGSTEEMSVTFKGISYSDTPIRLFERLAIAFWAERNYSNARSYLAARRDGNDHKTALAMASPDQIADKEFERLAELKLEDVIALFRNDPYKLKLYLQFAYENLNENEIDQLVIRSFKGLISGVNEPKEKEYLQYDRKLADVAVENEIPEYTEENTLVLNGRSAAKYIYISGSWNRRIRVNEDGTFAVTIPLHIGEKNEIRIMGVDTDTKLRSNQLTFFIEQGGKSDDVAAFIEKLGELRGAILDGVRNDPGRMRFFVQCAEKVLIKKFGRSFEEGKAYVRHLIQEAKNPIIKRVLQEVLNSFGVINKIKLPNTKEGSLMFFQKYCVHVIRRRMAKGSPGVILANDPGLGKTRTILAAVGNEEAAIFTPNSVVSTWDEEANEVLVKPELLILRDIPHAKRKDLLRKEKRPRLVTNIDFLRKTEDAERFALLSGNDTIVVHDEAHSRTNIQSEQSKGARKLKHKFQINVSATPFKNPKTLRRMLAILEPENPNFQFEKAFEKAFQASDPEALKALSILKEKYTIRFRKIDVMEEVDPSLPLGEQLHRLPRKEIIAPDAIGKFEMSEKQAYAVYEMFMDWNAWCKKYDKYMPKTKLAEEDHLRAAGSLTKRHALRQTINNPAYIGLQEDDKKAYQLQRIVRKCIAEGRKVVIFCAYNAQALKYKEILKKYKPAMFIGQVSQEGEKKDEKGEPMKFARQALDHHEIIYDERGYPRQECDPALDSSGKVEFEPMQALDYERLSFQNAPDCQVMIATYKAGAVGTTFTAGKAMIFDDYPADCVEAIQAEDRIHRIDPHRQTKYSVQYYSMQSRYPRRFLDEMKTRWVVKQKDGTYKEYKNQSDANANASEMKTTAQTAYEAFFAQGTYDQVHSRNLQTQRQILQLINDGIADESILEGTGENYAMLKE